MTNLASTADFASSADSSRGRAIAYWLTTLILGIEGVVGGTLALIRWPAYAGIIRHLGYPDYLMTILGVWYALAGLALLAPRLPRLKEWAYAGLVFNYTGAAASHLAAGDGASALVAPIIFTVLTVVSWALRPPSRRELAPNKAFFAVVGFPRSAVIAYWVTTALVASELAVGGVWDILRIPYVSAIIEHLGYPQYLLVILGVWKVPCAAALLVPNAPRLKEWAYAGAIFNYTGAVASHWAVGDGMDALSAPIIFTVLTAASSALRPPSRRDARRVQPQQSRY
jgi:uncharacterized membrane protein YphA (DoxX/SURF4 family)